MDGPICTGLVLSVNQVDNWLLDRLIQIEPI
jgi:hypothetical protein